MEPFAVDLGRVLIVERSLEIEEEEALARATIVWLENSEVEKRDLARETAELVEVGTLKVGEVL